MRPDAIAPTPERARHDAIREVPTDRAGIVAHQVVSPDALDRYWKREQLAPGQPGENARRFMAGERLRDAYDASGMAQRLTGGYEAGVDGWRDPDASLVAGLDAGRAYRRMLGLVWMPCRGDVFRCCCEGKAVGWRRMHILRTGLAWLADGLRL